MTSLTSELADVLRRIAEADRAGGGDVRFTPMFVEGAWGPVMVQPDIDGPQALQAGRMSALRELAYLEVEPATGGSSEFGAFRITAAGRDAIARYREPAARPVVAMDTSWERLRPILGVVLQQWEQQGARDAVDVDMIVAALADDMEGADVRRALELLEGDGCLVAEFEMGTDGPIAVTPNTKALQLLRGWPTEAGDAAIVQGLLDALDAAIQNTPDPDEKTRLQKLRAAAGDVAKGALAGAIVVAGKAATGG